MQILNMLITNLVALSSCHLSLFLFALEDSLPGLTNAHGEYLQWFIFAVEKPGAKIGGSTAVDNGAAYNIWALLERDSF